MSIKPATAQAYAEVEVEHIEGDLTEFENVLMSVSLPKGLRVRISKDENLSEEGHELVKEGILEIS
ncbi:MAG TPA: hypothetical protein VN844_09255 [Pyrinomonadaceae bacterium]|nr:hypothetical protein [Pyrinomonadaceae bacterium]